VPQTQTDPANVSEQVTDPVDLGTSSAIIPEQTVVIPPQGKVPITKSLPMTSFINIIVTLGNFQLKIFHRQLQPIKL
jgi:hypothetical protein